MLYEVITILRLFCKKDLKSRSHYFFAVGLLVVDVQPGGVLVAVEFFAAQAAGLEDPAVALGLTA